MPHLGDLHDDAVYVVAGRTIAEGLGPKIPSLPGEPALTKYPPVVPVLAAAVWLWNPDAATVRPWLTLLAWLPVPLLLGGLLVLYRRWGLPARFCWLLTALLALNGYLALYSTIVLSDVLFGALLVWMLIAFDDSRWVLAGVLAGLAYLTRSTGIVLLIAIAAGVWLHRRTWRGLIPAAVLLPVVAGWSLWMRAYRSPGLDRITAYYTDYVRELLWNATPANYPTMVWKNVQAWIASMGKLIAGGGDRPILQFLIAGLVLLSVVGLWRLCRQYPRAIPACLAAALTSGLLIAWCYPPTPRMTLPLLPVFLAGLAVLVAEFARKFRVTFAVCGGLFLLAVLPQQIDFWREQLPAYYAHHRRVAADNAACYERIRADLPADAKFVAHHDPVLWLYTGRQGIRPMFRWALWYEGKLDEKLEYYKDVSGFARQYGLGYLFQNREFFGDLNEEQFADYWRSLEQNPQLAPVFTCGATRVWRVIP